jgi:hypothetical protein
MGKNEIHWAILQGAVMLPFTIRKTKKQCVNDHLRDRSRFKLIGCEQCKKVIINEHKTGTPTGE